MFLRKDWRRNANSDRYPKESLRKHFCLKTMNGVWQISDTTGKEYWIFCSKDGRHS